MCIFIILLLLFFNVCMGHVIHNSIDLTVSERKILNASLELA